MAGPNAVAHRSLDGNRFHLAGPLDLTLPFTSVAEVRTNGRLVELTSGIRSLGTDLATALGHTVFDQEFAFQGGTLRLSTASAYEPRNRLHERPTLVVWEGETFALVGRLYHVTASDVLTLLRPLEPVEHDDGIVLSPRGGAEFVAPVTLLKEIPGTGLLEISPTERPSLRPRRAQDSDAPAVTTGTLPNGRPYFRLTGDRHAVTVLPLAGCDPRTVPDRLARLRIERSSPAWTS